MGLYDRDWMRREPSNQSHYKASAAPAASAASAAPVKPVPVGFLARTFNRGYLIFLAGMVFGTIVQVVLHRLFG